MNKSQTAERFKQVFGTEPTDSKTDQFFMGHLDSVINREVEKIKPRKYKAATIKVVVEYYSKSA